MDMLTVIIMVSGYLIGCCSFIFWQTVVSDFDEAIKQFKWFGWVLALFGPIQFFVGYWIWYDDRG